MQASSVAQPIWSRSELEFALAVHGFEGEPGAARFVRALDGAEVEVHEAPQQCSLLRSGGAEELMSWDELIRRVVEDLV